VINKAGGLVYQRNFAGVLRYTVTPISCSVQF